MYVYEVWMYQYIISYPDSETLVLIYWKHSRLRFDLYLSTHFWSQATISLEGTFREMDKIAKVIVRRPSAKRVNKVPTDKPSTDLTIWGILMTLWSDWRYRIPGIDWSEDSLLIRVRTRTSTTTRRRKKPNKDSLMEWSADQGEDGTCEHGCCCCCCKRSFVQLIVALQ